MVTQDTAAGGKKVRASFLVVFCRSTENNGTASEFLRVAAVPI